MPNKTGPLAPLPDWGYVSPLGFGSYPMPEASAQATVGLENPDATLGAIRGGCPEPC